MIKKISAIILSSGYSKRFGSSDKNTRHPATKGSGLPSFDKLLTKIKGKYIFEYVFDAVYAANFFEVIVAYRDDVIGKRALEYSFKAVQNNNASKGISESIKLGISSSSSDTDAYMFFQADQIFITKKDIDILTNTFDKNTNSIVIPYYDGKELSPVIFSKLLKNELFTLEGDVGGRAVIKNNRESIVHVDIDNEKLLFDIDTIDDFNKAKSMIL